LERSWPVSGNPLGGLTPMSEDFSIAQPDPVIDDTEDKAKKRLTKTRQWKEFIAFAKARQELYRSQTPGGVAYNNMPKIDRNFYSAVGNDVMNEYQIMINFMEGNNEQEISL
jgi:hypothetical protein